MNLLDLAREALAEAGSNRPSERNASHRWRVTTPAGTSVEVSTTPGATADEVRAIYPGAAVEPIAGEPQRPATAAERVELRTLIAGILTDDAERTEALEAARRDPDAALGCYRALAADV